MQLHYNIIQKNEFKKISDELYSILKENMNKILSGDNFDEKSREEWKRCICEALEKSPRELITIRDSNELAGFFMYYVNNGVFMMEEIQIKPEYQGKGVFRSLYRYLLEKIPPDTECVKAYANKENQKSHDILTYLGLSIVGDSADGRDYCYKGSYKQLKAQIYRG